MVATVVATALLAVATKAAAVSPKSVRHSLESRGFSGSIHLLGESGYEVCTFLCSKNIFQKYN